MQKKGNMAKKVIQKANIRDTGTMQRKNINEERAVGGGEGKKNVANGNGAVWPRN